MSILWISHRGYKKQAAENTREAFNAALQAGFHHLETDLRCTSDGYIVLSHDPNLWRIAKNPIILEKNSRRTLASVKLPFNNRLMFLDELLSDFKDTHWIFDIKKERANTTIHLLIELIRRHQLQDWIQSHVRFLVWKKSHEKLLRKSFPNAIFYAGQSECWRAGIATLLHVPGLGGIRPNRTYAIKSTLAGISLFKKRFVDMYHKRDASVIAFLPNTESETRLAIQAGIDEILTNDFPLTS